MFSISGKLKAWIEEATPTNCFGIPFEFCRKSLNFQQTTFQHYNILQRGISGIFYLLCRTRTAAPITAAWFPKQQLKWCWKICRFRHLFSMNSIISGLLRKSLVLKYSSPSTQTSKDIPHHLPPDIYYYSDIVSLVQTIHPPLGFSTVQRMAFHSSFFLWTDDIHFLSPVFFFLAFV